MADDLLSQIRLNGAVPRHVAVIMDGNGRWARERSLPRPRSEEHTSELQSQSNLVCRLLLEKKKTPSGTTTPPWHTCPWRSTIQERPAPAPPGCSRTRPRGGTR